MSLDQGFSGTTRDFFFSFTIDDNNDMISNRTTSHTLLTLLLQIMAPEVGFYGLTSEHVSRVRQQAAQFLIVSCLRQTGVGLFVSQCIFGPASSSEPCQFFEWYRLLNKVLRVSSLNMSVMLYFIQECIFDVKA